MSANEKMRRRHFPRWSFGLLICLSTVAILATLLIAIPAVVQKWASFRTETISVRLTSSRSVMWGDDFVAIASMRPDLEQSADLLRSHGFRPRLLIECYSDTRDSDVDALTRIGREVGFDIVETEHHSWPSPRATEQSE